ncbi:ImmA/IrrE family metallo-endopeptidase [Phorcysia thermohydrogeniphila]|nr:ImmA/IrrE family metallo-endopeptidase [Phorcysia thermohydrogeniphila]
MGLIERIRKQVDPVEMASRNLKLLMKNLKVERKKISEEAGVPEKFLIAVEKGEFVPFSVYEKIASYFGIYTSDFIGSKIEDSLIGVFFRHKGEEYLSLRDKHFLIRLKEWARVYRASYPVRETEILKKFRQVLKEANKRNVEEIGTRFRKIIGFDDYSLGQIKKWKTWEVKNWLRNIEESIHKAFGIKIIHVSPSAPPSFRSIYFPETEVIFIIDPRNIAINLFQIMHELFHSFRKEFVAEFDIFNGYDGHSEEDFLANQFAASVLIPRELLKKRLQQVSPKDVKELTSIYEEFLGSKEVFRYRLKALGCRNLEELVKEIKPGLRPIYITDKNKLPKEIKQALNKLREEGKITYNRWEELAKTDVLVGC